MNNEQIKKIMNDLYKIDKSFKKHEVALVEIISKLVESKPDVSIDENFVSRIRNELVKAAHYSIPVKKASSIWNNWTYALSGAGVMAIALLLIFSMGGDVTTKDQANEPVLKDGVIKQLSSGAFGSLVVSGGDSASRATLNESASSLDVAQGMGVGRGGGGAMSKETSSIAPMDASSEAKMTMPVPDYANYKFVYVGDELADIEAEMNVYRRVNPKQPGINVVSNLNELQLADLTKFKNLMVENLSFVEDREYGYNVYYNLTQNEVSINSSYQKWPNPYAGCTDDDCYKSQNLKKSDVLSDVEVIRIADQFLIDYGVNLDSYGPGKVDDNWLIAYEEALSLEREPYIPESVTVVYPLMINGEAVVDEGGRNYGLRVEVSNRFKLVRGAYSIRLNQFESSAYETENDKNKLIEYAERGGLNPVYINPEAKTVDVEIGTPEVRLINYWKYDKGDGTNEELYIPALVFPIKEQPTEGYFYRENIVIPLIKEIIKDRLGDNGPQIEPMPVLRTPMVEPMIMSEPDTLGGGDEPQVDSMQDALGKEAAGDVKMIK